MAVLLLACGGQDRGTPVAAPLPRDAGGEDARRDTAVGVEWGARYYEAYLGEVLRGDLPAARAAYREVGAAAGLVDPELAARAALRMAELEALAGRRADAVDWLARAAALGARNPEIVERADELRVSLAAARGQGEVRGPPAGTELFAASVEARARFAAAERELAAYHAVRVVPRLEDLQAGVRAKQQAMEGAVRAYRAVIALGDPAAQVAAEYRTGSVYHDLAIALVFDLPPELEPGAAARLRRSLRASAIGYLRKAKAAYQRSLSAAGAEGDRWRGAAELGLRSVEDLLRGSE